MTMNAHPRMAQQATADRWASMPARIRARLDHAVQRRSEGTLWCRCGWFTSGTAVVRKRRHEAHVRRCAR